MKMGKAEVPEAGVPRLVEPDGRHVLQFAIKLGHENMPAVA